MRSIFLPLLLAATLVAVAQTTIRDVFKQMPDSIVPYLDANNRLDFIDFIDSGMKAEVNNALGGKSVLQKLTDDFLDLSLNEAATLQMRLLDIAEPIDSANQVICMVRTYGSDIRESTVQFYSIKWRLLPTADYLTMPESDGLTMFIATFGEQEPTLTLQSECRLDAPANEEQKEIGKKQITLKWKGRFVKEF